MEAELTKNISNDSILHTDCFKSYNNLKEYFKSHKTVNHSKGFINHHDRTHTNTIEGCWYAIKANVPLRNRTHKDIALFLVRFMIMRNEDGDPLQNLLNHYIY